MNDDAFGELVALYRQSANETAPRRLDARVLRAARTRSAARRAWPWLGLAFAASIVMWLTARQLVSPRGASATDQATRAYLLQMDITPPASKRDAHLDAGPGGHTYQELP